MSAGKLQHAWLLTGILLAQCALPDARVAAAVTDPPPAATARPPAAPLAWKELQPNQQQLLQPYAKDWDSLPPGRQQALAGGARRWLSMDPAARAEARSLPELAEAAGRASAAHPQALGALSATRSGIKIPGAGKF